MSFVIISLFVGSDIAKNHQVRKKYTIQLGENELVLKVLGYLKNDFFIIFICNLLFFVMVGIGFVE